MKAKHVILILILLLVLMACDTQRDRWAGKVDYNIHGVTGY